MGRLTRGLEAFAAAEEEEDCWADMVGGLGCGACGFLFRISMSFELGVSGASLTVCVSGTVQD